MFRGCDARFPKREAKNSSMYSPHAARISIRAAKKIPYDINQLRGKRISKDENHQLTKLCHLVVGKDGIMDEIRQKLMENDHLILSLQERDTYEI
jgi:hypothetical protein